MSHKVFFSYHSKDRPQVGDIADELMARGLSVWLDRRSIEKSRDWIKEIEEAVEKSDSYAVFWGPEGYGEVQQIELALIKTYFVQKKGACCVVVLPGSPEEPPTDFLTAANQVRMKSRHDEEALTEICESLTGKKLERLEQPEVERPRLPDRAANALRSQISGLPQSRVSIFVGPTTDPQSDRCMKSIREDLIHALELEDGSLVEPVPRIETVGTYFGLAQGEQLLEQAVREHLEDTATEESPTTERIARFLRTVRDGARQVKRSVRRPQLVVTTRHDLMLERSLLREGLSFTRIVHFREANQLAAHAFRKVEVIGDRPGRVVRVVPSWTEDPVEVRADAPHELNRIIAQSTAAETLRIEKPGKDNELHRFVLDEETEVVLYKYGGSLDHPRSCMFSSEQMIEFARRVLEHRLVPDEVGKLYRNTQHLFLGYGLLDADLRLLRATLFSSEKLHPDFSVLVRPRPGVNGRPVFCETEQKLWGQLVDKASSLGFSLVELEEEEYLDELTSMAISKFRSRAA